MPPETVAPDGASGAALDTSSIATALEAWSTKSPWACPDPELWARLTSNLTFDVLVAEVWRAVSGRNLVDPYSSQPDGATLQSIGIPPWLLTDLLDRAELAPPTETEPIAYIGRLFNLASKVDTGEWQTRSGFADRLYRWTDSNSPLLLMLVYNLGLRLLSDSQALAMIHARLLAHVLEDQALRSSPMVSRTLEHPFWWRPFEASPEMDGYLCRIAAASTGSEQGTRMAMELLTAASNHGAHHSGGFTKVGQSVLEAWWPILRKIVSDGEDTMHQAIGAVHLNPSGTWSDPVFRESIINHLFWGGYMSAAHTAMVIAKWPEPGVRYLLERARKAPADDPSSIYPVTAAVAVAGYSHLLTDEEAMDLCLSPDSHYRQVGMLASGGAAAQASGPALGDPPASAQTNHPI